VEVTCFAALEVHVDVDRKQFGHELRVAIELLLGRAIFEDDVRALDPAEFAQRRGEDHRHADGSGTGD
jgi:hypothetical protein